MFFRSGNLLSLMTSAASTFSPFPSMSIPNMTPSWGFFCPPITLSFSSASVFFSCAPLSHAVHLLCCPLSWQAVIQSWRELGGTQFIFLFLSFLHDAMNTILAPHVCGGWMREQETGWRERSLFISIPCRHWRSTKLPTIGWDEWVSES